MYRSVGIHGFGIGASIVKKSLIDSGNFEAVTALAKQYRDAVVMEEASWQST
jgi:2-keto-3-deoxy-6-phosphogluconate aldolase